MGKKPPKGRSPRPVEHISGLLSTERSEEMSEDAEAWAIQNGMTPPLVVSEVQPVLGGWIVTIQDSADRTATAKYTQEKERSMWEMR
jgi:hypothetical protein